MVEKIDAVEVLCHLKGKEVHPKGRVYYAPDIPEDVMNEVLSGAGTVRVLTAMKPPEAPKAADSPPAPELDTQTPEAEKPEQGAFGTPETELPKFTCESCKEEFMSKRELTNHHKKSPECKMGG